MRKNRLKLAVALVVVAALAGYWVRGGMQRDQAARTLVQEYADLIASGDAGELQRLWAMESTETPGATRMAVTLLTRAEERIEVVEIGDPLPAAPKNVASVLMAETVAVPVTYRLDSQTYDASVTLGRFNRSGGKHPSQWRIVEGLHGSIAWDEPGLSALTVDIFVGGTRVVRTPRFLGRSEEDQPLYPAAYQTQIRTAPWFESVPAPLVVPAGEPTSPPRHELEPTARTQRRIKVLFRANINKCVDHIIYCQITDQLTAAGVDVLGDGLAQARWLRFPRMAFERSQVTLGGGRLRVRARGEPATTVKIAGRLGIGFDNQSWTPTIFDYDLQGG